MSSCAEKAREALHWRKVDGRCHACGTEEAEPGKVRCKKCASRWDAFTKAKYASLKLAVHEVYGNHCACCGEDETAFLSVDHVNNDGSSERKRSGLKNTMSLYQKIIREGFPDSYQILCMNCNFGKQRNGGICPHQTRNLADS